MCQILTCFNKRSVSVSIAVGQRFWKTLAILGCIHKNKSLLYFLCFRKSFLHITVLTSDATITVVVWTWYVVATKACCSHIFCASDLIRFLINRILEFHSRFAHENGTAIVSNS